MKQSQRKAFPRVIGLDAHSEKLVAALFVRSTEVFATSKDAKRLRVREGTVDQLEKMFEAFATEQDIIVLEASSNSFSIAERLVRIGKKVVVVKSDTLKAYSESDRVNDRIDAENLARAYIDGRTQEVYRPTKQEALWRDLAFCYRNSVKDCTRSSNRIWAFCSGHGFRLPVRSRKRKCEEVREQVLAHEWDARERFFVEELLLDYEHATARRKRCLALIEEIVSQTPAMLRAMKILGIRTVGAFFAVAFIGDVRRFETPKKLVRYIGLNPRVNCSGKSKGDDSCRDGGRRDLKSLLVESAQCALRYGQDSVHRWARRKTFSKPRNVAVCALARKLATYLWHALMGHPTPSEEPQGYRTKLVKLATSLGAPRLRELGYKNSAAFIETLLQLAAPVPATPLS